MTEFIQIKPGPTDAELQAERDAKHAQEVQWWLSQHADLDSGAPLCEECGHGLDKHDGSKRSCTATVVDLWGEWICDCYGFVGDPDA